MRTDPFGSLANWDKVLETIDKLVKNRKLTECQPGLVRILRYKGNWQLREKVLNRAGEIKNPSSELISQVLEILGDDNIYYDARILAGDALIDIYKNSPDSFNSRIKTNIKKVTERIWTTPIPPVFFRTLTKLYTEICQSKN